jgi:predicted CoA-binding protein
MEDIVTLLDDPATTIAIVGATANTAKYGNVIVRDLKRKGYKIYAVNPKTPVIEGEQAYAKLSDLHESPTIVNIVVPSRTTIEILKQCLSLNLKNVWIQPGAESPEVMTFLQGNDFNYLANACIMVQSRLKT